MKSIFSLFADKYILAFFVAILVLVGVDVGVNVTFPKYLQQTCDLSLTESALGNSVYFFSRTVGALLGGILLMKMRETKFYNVSIVIAVIGLLGLIFVHSHFFALVFVSIFGLGYSNLFAIVVSMAMKHKPERSNDISALMIMGVAGGGVLPPLMGVITDFTGNQWSAILVLAVVWLYMFTLMGKIKRINSYVK
jgi:fucose permease